MPSIETHIKLSLGRTGKEYREIHEWMNDKSISSEETAARHSIINIPRFLPIIESKFGKDYVNEYLYHIKDDYENHIALRIFRKLKRLKFW